MKKKYSSEMRKRLNRVWFELRNLYLHHNPKCHICGTTENLIVHHITPYKDCPELYLEWDNLVTLCSKPNGGCHFVAGHLCDWKMHNKNLMDYTKK